MSYIDVRSGKTAVAVLALVAGLIGGCRGSIQSGSTSSSFLGVESVTAISPTAVEVRWTKNSKYSEYRVYANFQADPVAVQVFDRAIIESLQPGTEYSFKVIGVGKDGQSGGNIERKVRTWERFQGPESLKKDADGNFVLTWNYPHPNIEFLIFYKKNEDPTAENTDNWKTPNLTTQEQSITIKDLDGATRYHFVVHAKYREGEYERPNKVLKESTEASFPTPNFTLGKVSIGTLPFVTVDPVVNALYKEEYYLTEVFQGNERITDPLVGKGTAVFSAQKNWPLGKIDNISIRFTYDDGNIRETLVVDNLSTYLKGIVPFFDQPAINSLQAGPAFLGESIATGDFNCDGYKDLAIGMPRASVASLGSRYSLTGAVYIYYSIFNPATGETKLNLSPEPRIDPVNPGVDPQIITFDDLYYGDRFGMSLASGGNLNGDRVGQNECEDLIVGAPYHRPSNAIGYGAVFVFFGSAKGLRAPQHVSDTSDNVETCDGLIENASCSAVRLFPDYSKWPIPYTGAFNAENYGEFGAAVSFIGDFNGDGYDDIAIGDPRAHWDGVVVPGLPNWNGHVLDVGAVYIFFGSRYGIGTEAPFAAGTPGPSDLRFRFLKIYPPFPQSGMRFGASIAGGADVDGAFRVRGPDGKNYGGSDMVIGAPGFRYFDPTTTLLPLTSGDSTTNRGITPAAGGWRPSSAGVGYASSSSYYGITQNDSDVSTGIAFVYFGRAFRNSSPPGAANVEQPSRLDFWSCGQRGMISTSEHFSCLAENSNFRVLFPRNSTSRGFGKSVAILGNRSRYDESNNEVSTKIDPNQDGFAEIVVGAPDSDAGGVAQAGVLWQFYGNPALAFEANDFYNLYSDGQPTSDWIDVTSGPCASFATVDTTTKRNCAPVQIRTNSITANAKMAFTKNSLAVGDITGDGVLDLAVGVPYDSTQGNRSGAVMVFTSQPGYGLTQNYKKIYLGTGDSDDNLGWSVAIGNFDGDRQTIAPFLPYNDIVAGAPNDETSRAGGGAVYFFNSNGLSLPAIRSYADYVIFDSLASTQDYGYEAARIVGDINGDGYDDALAKMTRYDSAGAVNHDLVVYFGSKHGLITTSFCKKYPDRVLASGSTSECYPATSHPLNAAQPGITLPQLVERPTGVSARWARFGYDAGDINGDGFDDVAVVDNDQNSGQVVVYYGTRGGLQAIVNPAWRPAINDPQIVTKKYIPTINYYQTTRIGYDMRSSPLVVHGDFNGDGYSDIVISRPTARGPVVNKTNPLLPHTNHNTSSIGAGDGWLCTVSTDQDDLCQMGYGPDNHGMVTIVYGSKEGLQTPSLRGTHAAGTDFTENDPTTVIDGYGTETGSTKACNGLDPNVCTSENLRNPVLANIDFGWTKLSHFFGASVTVMDFDNDGYDDLLVGAPGFEDIKCWDDSSQSAPRDYGRVYLYRGSKYGILAADRSEYYSAYDPAQTCPLQDAPTLGDPALGTIRGGSKTMRALMPPIASYASGSNLRERQFGLTMTVAGDVNGDGYEDLAVGIPFEHVPGARRGGSFFLYYGPLCGTDNDSIVALAIQSETNLNKQKQFSDPDFGGVAFAPECMKPTGVKPAPMKVFVYDVGADDFYGTTLVSHRKGKADVNGDGYDDVLFGAGFWNNTVTGVNDSGRGIVYFGGPSGLFADDFAGSSVVTQPGNKIKPLQIVPETTESGMEFFRFNVSSGDVNGDGTLDFMIPSPYSRGEGEVIGINLGTFMMFY